MALSKILPASQEQYAGARNLIINGSQIVAQRGISVTGLTSSSTYHTVDRWQFNMGSIGTFSISQSTTAPSGFSNSLKLSCTTANASPAAGAYLQLIHKIEGQNLQHLKKGASDAESVTLSFWCRCSKTGDFVIELRDGANNRHICSLVTISSADTWEYKTITFAGDTTGTLANDNTTGFELGIWLSAGTDFTSGTLPASWASSTNANRAVGVFNLAASTDDFYITGVQLELGSTATDFEHRSFGDELARCQRYFEKSYAYQTSIGTSTGTGAVSCDSDVSSTGSRFFIFSANDFKVTKRTTPTLTIYSQDGVIDTISKYNSPSTKVTVSSVVSRSDSSLGTYIQGATSDITQPYNFHWVADAEL